MASRHQTLPHVQWWPRFIKFFQKFQWSLPLEIWRPKNIKFWRDFAQLRDLIANNSGMQHNINRKTALQTTDTPVQGNLIRCTLVHKWRKIGPEFWSTHRVTIRLGIATHLVSSFVFMYSCWNETTGQFLVSMLLPVLELLYQYLSVLQINDWLQASLALQCSMHSVHRRTIGCLWRQMQSGTCLLVVCTLLVAFAV